MPSQLLRCSQGNDLITLLESTCEQLAQDLSFGSAAEASAKNLTEDST